MSKLHRVQVYVNDIDITEILFTSPNEQFQAQLELFKLQPECAWVLEHAVTLGYDIDDVSAAFGRRLKIYADLTDKQYVDFLLRFDYDSHVYENSNAR